MFRTCCQPWNAKEKKRKVGKRLFPLYELILAESRLNSFRLVSFPKFYFWVKLSKRCARIPFLLTHSYYQSFGLIPLDTYNRSSFHFWSKHPKRCAKLDFPRTCLSPLELLESWGSRALELKDPRIQRLKAPRAQELPRARELKYPNLDLWTPGPLDL